MNGKKLWKRKTAISIIIIVFLLVSSYILLERNKPQEDIMPLREYKVFQGDITAGITADGYLFLPVVSHYFDIPVQLEAIYVRKGDTIKIGDKIAKAVGEELPDPYLYSKLDGIVTSVPLVEGEMTSGRPIVAQIGDPTKVKANLKVSQSDISEAEVGQLVDFTFNAYPTQTVQGTVTQVQWAPIAANPVEYSVFATLDTQDMLLLEGMTFSAQIVQKQVKNVLCLSNKAIYLKDGKQIVRVMDQDGNMLEKEIQTGFSDGRYSEILSGLSNGDIVYVEE